MIGEYRPKGVSAQPKPAVCDRRSRLRRLALRAPSPRKLSPNHPHYRPSAPKKAAPIGTAFPLLISLFRPG